MRIGNGYDVHRLVDNRKLTLGGVTLDYPKGLLGHSDADVLVHAIMDALLGAMAKGDIGKHFPDSLAQYKNISSITLLGRVYDMLAKENYAISNIDATIVAQEPRLFSYIDTMRENIANALHISLGQINIKATTEEGLGFTGNKEGISAYAVCLISKENEQLL